MRRIFTACLVTLFIVILSDNVSAYYLDSPHNESNGIYCHNCHNNPSWYWVGSKDPNDPTNIDKTTRNAVCNNCHGNKIVRDGLNPLGDIVYPAGYIEGPNKELHSSTTTSESHGIWTIQCTQCHSPHFQGQLDWDQEDSSKLYLAKGDITSDPIPSGSNTTITFTGLTSQPGFADTSLWTSKGGTAGNPNAHAFTATDGTRGLLLVPDISNPDTETFEIIDVTGNTITVKGTMTGNLNNLIFGVVYGQNIRSFMANANGNGFRDVKFFKAGLNPGDYGGYVDLTPGATPPVGLCQVCHVAPAHWRTDGSGQEHNYWKSCGECHVAEKGFGPFSHLFNFFTDANQCGSCHSRDLDAPESGHASCSSCHDPTGVPVINSSVTLTAEGKSVRDSLLFAGYYFDGTDARLRDSAGNAIGDPGFQHISCATCHTINANDFNDHTSETHFRVISTTGGACEICHNAVTTPFVTPVNPLRVPPAPGDEVHSRSTCSHCHDYDEASSTGTGAFLGSTAQNHTIGTVSDCMTCHGTFYHEINHANVFFDPVNDISEFGNTGCITCHYALTGDATSLDTWPGIVAEHDKRDGVWDGIGGCTTCHDYDGTNGVLTVTPVADVWAALAAGGAPVSCGTCHSDKLIP